jgi:NRPS condensation-like uncharacterized protein
MTNVGILDPDQVSFGDLRPHDAFLCGSIKYKPYFQLAMSSYEGELTLSVNLRGSANDRDRILSFFDEMEAELRSWDAAQRAESESAVVTRKWETAHPSLRTV